MTSSKLDVHGLAYLFHPLGMNSFGHWVHLLRANNGVDRDNFLRVMAISAASVAWSPLRLAEDFLYGKRIAQTEISAPPIFIIGHWRTGTTLVHYLMSQDPNLGSISLFQTLAPASYLIGRHFLRPLMARFVPKTRPMDNMALGLDLPQEEEYALCNLTACSLYTGWYFPRRMQRLFREYGLFEGVPAAVVDGWKEVYTELLKKATYHAGGNRLILKNPVNTARIRYLLELFPEAKFIHVYRNPYHVYKSTQLLHRSAIDGVGLQQLTDAEIEENVLILYRQMMERFFEDRNLIPRQNLAEVRFEDLEREPVAELRRIYGELALPGWEKAGDKVEAYAAGLQGYVKNSFSLEQKDVARIRDCWGFAIDHWGYAVPS